MTRIKKKYGGNFTITRNYSGYVGLTKKKKKKRNPFKLYDQLINEYAVFIS